MVQFGTAETAVAHLGSDRVRFVRRGEWAGSNQKKFARRIRSKAIINVLNVAVPKNVWSSIRVSPFRGFCDIQPRTYLVRQRRTAHGGRRPVTPHRLFTSAAGGGRYTDSQGRTRH